MTVELNIKVNGEARILKASSSLQEFMEGLGLPSLERGVAVCLNGEVISRDQWKARELRAGDELEIVQATQGG